MTDVSSGKKIAKNTLMLYFRQILIMLVSLYTVRIVLSVLGAEDYGINNVVAGFVTMFNFLSTAMASASQRYFSYDLGVGNTEHLQRTFSVTFALYFILCLFVILVAETLGLWFVCNKLIIAENRKIASIWIYQFSIISFLMTLITTPYKAAIIAHENMDAYAYISIIEVVLKLAIVFLLNIIRLDKLIVYGFLHCVVVVINTLMYRIYAKRKFAECKFRFVWDAKLLKEMFSYSAWNLFGTLASVLKSQGLNIVLNLFFGPIVNAARGVAYQVNNAVVTFANNFSTAMRPQIIKNYASGNIEKSIKLVNTGCKLAYFLMFIFTLPLCLEMDFVLNVWLKNPPDLAVLFTQLVLINAMIEAMNHPVMTLAQSTGKIKLYQGVVGGLLLLNMPVSYLFLYLGYSAYVPFLITIVLTLVASIVRLFVVHRIVKQFNVLSYIVSVYFPCLLASLLTIGVPYWITKILKNQVLEFFVVVIVSVLSTLVFMLLIGFNRKEKEVLINIIKNKIGKKK